MGTSGTTYEIKRPGPLFTIADSYALFTTSTNLATTKVTPLEQYRTELRRAGHTEVFITDVIEGLADSPLYESQTTQQL